MHVLQLSRALATAKATALANAEKSFAQTHTWILAIHALATACWWCVCICMCVGVLLFSLVDCPNLVLKTWRQRFSNSIFRPTYFLWRIEIESGQNFAILLFRNFAIFLTVPTKVKCQQTRVVFGDNTQITLVCGRVIIEWMLLILLRN